MLTIDVEDGIRKFNRAAYNTLLCTRHLREVIRCELIVEKYLPVAVSLYGIRVFQLPIVTCTNYTFLIEKYTDIFLRCRYTCQ